MSREKLERMRSVYVIASPAASRIGQIYICWNIGCFRTTRMVVTQGSKLHLLRRCCRCMDWPPTAMHLDRCTPRCRMYSRWADAHHKRAEAEIIEYEKTGYEKQCRKQIMAVTVDESDESSFEVEEETELDFAADQEGEHTHNVDEDGVSKDFLGRTKRSVFAVHLKDFNGKYFATMGQSTYQDDVTSKVNQYSIRQAAYELVAFFTTVNVSPANHKACAAERQSQIVGLEARIEASERRCAEAEGRAAERDARAAELQRRLGELQAAVEAERQRADKAARGAAETERARALLALRLAELEDCPPQATPQGSGSDEEGWCSVDVGRAEH
ncbi:unnamed protein product, partial [Prorocentrum cordatum]